MNDCSFLDNSATTAGGAIYNEEGTLSVVNSTFSGNSSELGGVIDNVSSLTLINSTFSENTSWFGGGLFNEEAKAAIVNSTFFNNSASIAGGAFYNLASLSLKSAVLADSIGGNCDNVNHFGTLTDEGYNLSDDGSSNFETTNPSSSKDSVTNLDLGAPANNGGPTETIALSNASAAIGLIPVASCTYQNVNPCTTPPTVSSSGPLVCDQRAEPRPNPGANPPVCDSGAFELQRIPFAQFKPALSVDLPDNLLLLGSFSVGKSGTLNLATQPVTLTLSSTDLAQVSLTIPAGSFKKVAGEYLFKGKINGASDLAEITQQPNKNSYTFEISATGLDLVGIGNPVTVTLQVGPNTGTATVDITIQ